jgi:hypothetical protein
MASNPPFFVRRITDDGVDYVDLESGLIAEPLDIPFDQAQHGLCETLGKPVYKLLSKRLVLAPIGDYKERMAALEKLRPITVDTHDSHKHRVKWIFEPLDLYEILLGLDQGFTEHELATLACSPLEAIRNLLQVIERRGLMEKVFGGEGNGGDPPERRSGDTEGLSYDLRY